MALGAAAIGSADATFGVALVEVVALGATGLVLAAGGGGATVGAPDDEVGAGISSVLNGVGLSPSGTAPGAGTATALLFCMFKSAAGGTETEKVGSYNERIELAGMSCISRGPSELTNRVRWSSARERRSVLFRTT